MITVHHLEYSQSFRALWLMEALGVNYAFKLYERDAKTRLAPAKYKALSPLGTAPVITEGDLVLSETNAVMDYILDAHDDGTLRPTIGSAERVPYLFWFHAAQGSHMPLLLMKTVFSIAGSRAPFFVRPIVNGMGGQVNSAMIAPRMTALLEKAETDLAQTKWLAADHLTAADIVMCYGMEASRHAGYITDAHPNCQRWLEQMHADPAFQRALAQDGKDTIIFKVG